MLNRVQLFVFRGAAPEKPKKLTLVKHDELLVMKRTVTPCP